MSLLESLPHELIIDIFERACLADLDAVLRHDHDRDGEHGPLYRTVLSLCLVSRQFYSIAVPLLYRNICAGGRGTLRRLGRTLRARPELAVCAVHVLLSDRARVSTKSTTTTTTSSVSSIRSGANATGGDNEVDSEAETLVNVEDEDEEDEMPPKFAFWFPRNQEARLQQQARMKKWWEARVHALNEMRECIVGVVGMCLFSLLSLSCTNE